MTKKLPPVEIGAPQTWRHEDATVVPLLCRPLKRPVFMARKALRGD
jgi:hypothetical protein